MKYSKLSRVKSCLHQVHIIVRFLRTSPSKRPRPSIHTEQQFRLDRKYTNVTGCDE